MTLRPQTHISVTGRMAHWFEAQNDAIFNKPILFKFKDLQTLTEDTQITTFLFYTQL